MKSKANIVVGVLVIALAAVAAALLVVPAMFPDESSDELRAIVHDGDGATHEISLAQNSEIAISTSLGTNVVRVQDGAVCVSDADCENHDCIRQGSINAPGSQIICLPHKLWIELVTDGESQGHMDIGAAAGSMEDIDVTSR